MFTWIKKLFNRNTVETVEPEVLELQALGMQELVMDLRQQGKTVKEISLEIGKTENQTKYLINKLIKSGKVERKTHKKGSLV